MRASVTEIHQSVADAENLEDVHDATMSVGDVFTSLFRHPRQIITRWNWKAALLGAILRASFYFTVYRASQENWVVTLTAVLVELGFRFFTSGISGSLVQSFRRAEPTWLATLIVTLSLPVFSHTVEYIAHYSQERFFNNIFAASENNARQKAFAVSVLISVLSAMFNLFVMKNGVLLVGAGSETKSLWGDLKRIPFLVVEFITFLPGKILLFLREGKFLEAIGIFVSFGLAIGTLMGIFRGKWSWAWTTALGAWAILLAMTLLVAVVLRLWQPTVKS
jgi:hypothetical protein